MLKSKRALVLSVISLLSSLICSVQSENRTSTTRSSNNADSSHYKYNHSSIFNNISQSGNSGSNAIEHNNPIATNDLHSRNPPVSDSSNDKTAYQYAINDNDSNEAPTIASHPHFSTPLSVEHGLNVANSVFNGGAQEGSRTGTPLSSYHKKTAVRSVSTEPNHQQPHLKFAILLPEHGRSRDSRILSTVRPVIEMATNLVTGPDGVLHNLKIEIDYRDTQCSSTYGALGAFDILLKRKPGTTRQGQIGLKPKYFLLSVVGLLFIRLVHKLTRLFLHITLPNASPRNRNRMKFIIHSRIHLLPVS